MDKRERKDEVRDHEYDGIQEYDNSLPRWWIGTFVITVLFGFYYWTTRHFEWNETTPLQGVTTSTAGVEIPSPPPADNQGGSTTTLAAVDEKKLLDSLKNSEIRAQGKNLFLTHCAACHVADGGGMIGPNLTDKAWLHGGKPGEILHTVTNGVPAKGMVPWKGTLTRAQIEAVTVHVISLQGTTPANPKAPEGK